MQHKKKADWLDGASQTSGFPFRIQNANGRNEPRSRGNKVDEKQDAEKRHDGETEWFAGDSKTEDAP
ncbi:hypothetical protein NDU88_000790 [Pleurodeles waltl]|uniref:Uncharacterized protein n=1 Tax=Pleurodeles waltl TaxID=8319 RepID=A0AAV7R9R1_PLEWA|nr:hypothetical protein NDU88_000790 [Pleurodeles waltl]